jgi:hexosaminidase
MEYTMNFDNLLTFILFITILIGISVFSGCSSADETKTIEVSAVNASWNLVSNYEEGGDFRSVLTLTNSGDEALPAAGWSLYLNSVRPLVAESLLPDFELDHINGDFFKLTPTSSFSGIEPGASYELEYLSRFHAIKFTDSPQGLYFLFDDGQIETINSVQVEPFTGEEQQNRSINDNIPYPTPDVLYADNEGSEFLSRDSVSPVTPTPVSMEESEGLFSFEGDVKIYLSDDSLEPEARFLQAMLNENHDITTTIETASEEPVEGILLVLDESINQPEGYTLLVGNERIVIGGSDRAGVFYGVQSLRSLIANRESDALTISGTMIEDSPAFEYRGMHLDVARNFQSIESVKRLLDLMSVYKLNKFHFHLTDDEGWRIAIDGLPELTEVGGRRGHTETEDNHLIPSYGSGPDPSIGNSFGSGWYSRDEYIDILQYASERHIEVIPEIDVPGHARAAIVAMKSRAARLEAEGDSEAAAEFRLDEPEDQSEYRSIQNFDDNVINVCQESTYRFLEYVVDDIVAMHEEADVPLTTIHVGGDEVPTGVWTASPACQSLEANEDVSGKNELEQYFFSRLENMLSGKNLKMAGWEEVAFMQDEDGNHVPNPDFNNTVIPHIWSNIWGGGTEGYTYELANSGFKVIMSHASNFYFDFAYNKHWQEPGFYWAAMFNSKTPYSFIPFNLYRNAQTDSNGNPIPDNYFDGFEELSEAGESNILGLQGQLWTETVNREGAIDYMIFPRLLALAERAWVGDASWSDVQNETDMWQQRDDAWNEFANRLGQFEMNRLDLYHEGVNYRIPAAGAVVRGGVFYANSLYPGLTIRYQVDGPVTDQSPEFTRPIELLGGEQVSVALFNSEGRSGRAVTIPLN